MSGKDAISAPQPGYRFATSETTVAITPETMPFTTRYHMESPGAALRS